MDPQQILFVDDDANLLSGLRRMLRPMRTQWEMTFALGGREALKHLHERCFDVVVTDMKMPEIDGASLLQQVHELCPYAARLVLSGQADSDAVFKVIKHSHQFLSKPCSAEVLKGRISQACESRELLGGRDVKQFVSGITEIPVRKSTCESLRTLMKNEEVDLNEITRVLSTDVSMTSKILQLVNSSYFGEGSEVYSVREAVGLLGKDILMDLFHSGELLNEVDLDPAILCLDGVSLHSQRVAETAAKLCQLEGLNENLREQAMTAGLLHELGRVLFATAQPEKYREVHKLVKEDGFSLTQAEIAIFSSSHAEVGAYLLALWNVPEPIVEAVAFHCLPHRSNNRTFNVLSAVHVANAIEDEIRPIPRYDSDLTLDSIYMREIDRQDNLADWKKALT